MSRRESKLWHSDKRRRSFCTECQSEDIEAALALSGQNSQPPQVFAQSEFISRTATKSSAILGQATIDPTNASTVLHMEALQLSGGKKEKRPKTPKLTKEEKRAASAANSGRKKNVKGDMAASELLKTTNLLPCEEPDRSVTAYPAPRADIQGVPIKFEPTHMMSRPLRAYARQYQPSSPQPLLELSATHSPTVSAGPVGSVTGVFTGSSPLVFSYQSSDPNVAMPSTMTIAGTRHHPPPRRKGLLFSAANPFVQPDHNSHEPEMLLHRNLPYYYPTQQEDASSPATSRLAHSYSAQIVPMGQVPQPVMPIDDIAPTFRATRIQDTASIPPTAIVRPTRPASASSASMLSETQPLEGTHKESPVFASILDSRHSSLSIQYRHPEPAGVEEIIATGMAARRPRPMSTKNTVPMPQPSVFAGVDRASDFMQPQVFHPAGSTDLMPSAATSRSVRQQNPVPRINFALSAYSYADTSLQYNGIHVEEPAHTPEVYCSQGGSLRTSLCQQPKSQSLGFVPRGSPMMIAVPTAAPSNVYGSEHFNEDLSTRAKCLRDLLSHDHTLDIEAAITDIINVESMRFGNLASSRIRDILLDKARGIPENASPGEKYRLIREQFNQFESTFCNSILQPTQPTSSTTPNSRNISPAIIHAVARCESKTTRQVKESTTQPEPAFSAELPCSPPKNVEAAEKSGAEHPDTQPSVSLDSHIVCSVPMSSRALGERVSDSSAVTSSDVPEQQADDEICMDMTSKPAAEDVPEPKEAEHTALPDEHILQDGAEQVLRSLSPDTSLPSVSPDTSATAPQDSSLLTLSLQHSLVEAAAEHKMLGDTAMRSGHHWTTPTATLLRVNASNGMTMSDLTLDKMKRQPTPQFVQRIVYDTSACVFDSETQSVTPMPVLAMDYSEKGNLLTTVSEDGVVRLYVVPLLQSESYQQLKDEVGSTLSSSTKHNVSIPAATYMPQHAMLVPSARPRVMRLRSPYLAIGYDDGHIVVLDLSSMTERAYWRAQSGGPIIDIYYCEEKGEKSAETLDSVVTASTGNADTSQQDLLPSSPQPSIFICTEKALSLYSIAKGEEWEINMSTYVHAEETIQFSALTQSKDNPNEIYVGCVGGTIFKFFNFEPQRRMSLNQTDKIISLSVSGDILAIGCHNGMTVIFSTLEMHSHYRLKSYRDSPVSAVYCDGDKIVIANANGVFSLWERQMHLHCVHSSKVHSEAIVGLVVAGNRIVTSSRDGYTNCFELQSSVEHQLHSHCR